MDEIDENTPAPEPEKKIEEIDDAIAEIFQQFETRLAAIERQFNEEFTSIRKSVSEHASRYEHAERRREEDRKPGERHFYFRHVGN